MQNHVMDNIHVTPHSPSKQSQHFINSFNTKTLDQAEKAGDKSSGMNLSVQWILFLGIVSVIGVFVIIACLISSVHRVSEGNVALYYKYGALLPDHTGPGIHTCAPFVTSVLQVTVRPETRIMDPMKCTTKDGVSNVFKNVQIITSVNVDRVYDLVTKFGNDMKKVLIYDRIAQGIQDFCANNSIDEVYNSKFVELSSSVENSLRESMIRLSDSGINILNLFIPKPDIPPAIAANYREVKIEWTRQLVAEQKKKTEKINKETVLQNEVMDAEREKEVQRIHNERMISRKEYEKNISSINNTINTAKENTLTDIQSYRKNSDAKNNEALLTDQYIKNKMAEGLLHNTKIFFSGQDSALGSLFSNILKLDGDSNTG